MKDYSKAIKLSVLLVVRNEERYIAELIDNLLEQETDGFEMELLIIDGDSSDQTTSIVDSYVDRYPFIKRLRNAKKTLPIGWNIGIKQAKGDYILRIDGHTAISKHFLASYLDVIKRHPEADVVGGIIESRGTGKQGRLNQYVYSHAFGVGNSKFRTLEGKTWEGYVDTVPYGAYKRSVFEEVGLFDERLKRNEDIEFHKRMRDKGKTFFLSTSIHSTYFVRNTIGGLINKSLDDGTWNIIANRVTPGSLGMRHRIPLAAFTGGLFFVIASLFSTTVFSLFVILFMLYIGLTLAASLRYAKEHGYVWIVPCGLTFFTMHFFRGLGSFRAYFSPAFWRIRKQTI